MPNFKLDTANPFLRSQPNVESPAIAAYAITPSDDTDLAVPIRAITIGLTGGTVRYISSIDGATYTTGTLPVGNYPLFASRILATSTTATGITGWA